MIRKICLVAGCLVAILSQSSLYAQGNFSLSEKFVAPTTKYDKIGRGICQTGNAELVTKDAYLAFGEHTWADYEIKFIARVPDTASQVQICAGFRAANRDDRYIIMLKGGIQQYLYLVRLGYMGNDDYLALRKLDFVPRPGKWYKFRIQVAGNRIRAFINDEKLPRIDITDQNGSYAAAGKITLGGSWITNEFRDLNINSLNKGEILSLPVQEYAAPAIDKEALRKQQRAAYKPVVVKSIDNLRTEISLDGTWLFAPGYEISDEGAAIQPTQNDSAWHVMHVPDFWNPSRVWLHGERYNSGSKGVSDNYYQKETDRCEAYTFDYKKTSTGWYRQWINLPKTIKGKNLQLSFDAVSKVSEVWVNGIKAGSHIGMFGDFQIDVTGLLKPGKNLVAVKVVRDYVRDIKDADKIVGVAVTVEVTQKMVKDIAHDFYGDDPGGIWQPVSLIITDPLRIEDVFIKPGLTGADFDVTVKNYNKSPKTFGLKTTINGIKFQDALYKNISVKALTLEPGEQKIFTYRITNIKPRLWSPEHPNLYNFNFSLVSDDGRQLIDSKNIHSGFRTFKVIGDYFYLNGNRYWLRGANQTAMPLAPNDSLLADKFCKLMRAGNMMVTRTVTAPYDETWLKASDENGIGISYEGTWPWLFLETSMPDQKLVDLWKTEFLELLKKYRNHPSLFMWTVNNEMKFYENDPDMERAKVKMKIISDVVKQMRAIDPTRPVIFDSNYRRNIRRFGADYFKTVDDGDVDDNHAYINWYTGSIFDEFNGEWQERNKIAGRPLISQEMATGYTDETGHATRYYSYVHQNPQALAGKFVYDYCDPKYFMIPQAFISKELAEALRRSDDKSAGVLHFSLITWFTNAYLADRIKPFPVYYDMKTALQPVLVSAELWGRHFYAGEQLPVRMCVINDLENGSTLPASRLQWQVTGENGLPIAKGDVNIPPVAHYTRYWLAPRLQIPQNLSRQKVKGKLLLKLVSNGRIVSRNYYDLLLVRKKGITAGLDQKGITLVDFSRKISGTFDFLGIKYVAEASVKNAIGQNPKLLVLAGLDESNTNIDEINLLKLWISKGNKVLLLNSGYLALKLYPQYLRDLIDEPGEIVNMEIPESGVFDGIEPLEIRYFNNNKREKPTVSSDAFKINRDPHVEALASFTEVHGYLAGNIERRIDEMDNIRGFPIVQINDNGEIIISEMLLEKAITDPVAAKLLINMLRNLD